MVSLGMALYRLWQGVRSGFHDPVFRALLTVLLLMIAGATVFYRSAEGWAWIDCVYYAVMTLTTNTPQGLGLSRGISKIFTIVYVFTGTGVMITFAITLGYHIMGVAKSTRPTDKIETDRPEPGR